jgi:Domain of unknown function (DUF4136)
MSERSEDMNTDCEDNMKFRTRLTLITASLLLITSAVWAKTSTDYDHNANFSNYKTYSWGKVDTADSLWDQRVKQAVDSQLAAKGWTQVPSGGDVMVNAFRKSRSERTLNTFYDGFPGGWRWGGFGGEATTTVDTYKVGTLLIDMFDANSKNLIWRGKATDTLSSNPDKDIKKLDSEVHDLFKHFPPK